MLGSVAVGISNSLLNPNFSACSRIAASPSSMPSSANGMLHERRSASASVTSAPPPQVPPPELRTTASVPGSVSDAGFGKVDSGVYRPDSSAAAVTTSLNVDPGGFMSPPVARLNSGSLGSASSPS